MGAQESKGQNQYDDQAKQSGIPDYYQVLEVEETATADEIKVFGTILPLDAIIH